MSYELNYRETLAMGLSRVLEEMTGEAYASLTNFSDKDTGIHEARKRFKRIRAVVKMLRFAMGDKWYRRENAFYRDMGKGLSAMRDQAALSEALDTLYVSGAGRLSSEVCVALQKQIEQLGAELEAGSVDLEEAAQALEQHKAATTKLSDNKAQLKELMQGLQSTYRICSRLGNTIETHKGMETVHEWRKAVKFLLYQLELLIAAWPDMLDWWTGRMKKLSNDLGLWRDLGLLRAALEEGKLVSDHSALIVDLIEEQRTILLDEAIYLGVRLFTESPAQFSNRLKGYWKKARKQAEAISLAGEAQDAV